MRRLQKITICLLTLCLLIGTVACNRQGGTTEVDDGYFKAMTMTEGELCVFDRSESLTHEQAYFAESVQGLMAQIGNAKYYHYRPDSYDTWLQEIGDRYGKATRDVTVEEMLADYVDTFAGGGYVLCDLKNGASANCARSIAGAKQVVIVDTTLEAWAQEHGLVKQFDATAMTEKQCFETFRDAFDNGGLVQQKGTLLQLTDYAVACRYFCYFVTDQKPASLQFRNTVQSWCADCPVYGWCPLDEGTDVSFSSRYGSFTLASDYCYNMSVFSCVDFFGETQLRQKFTAATQEYALDKHYITIVNSDGDNLQCWYGGTFERDTLMGAARGAFPMGWSVSPALYDLAPNILARTYREAEKGDRFVCSVSGLGYMYPMLYGEQALARYCTALNGYLQKTDLSVVKILDNGLDDKTIRCYSEMSNAKGFLYCTYSDSYVGEHGAVHWSENGKPFVSCRATMWNSTPEAIAAQINAYPADATTIAGYTYVNLHVWSMNYNDVKAMVEQLDPHVVVVDPDTFIDLIVKNVPHENAQP